jgi:endoglucanase
MSIATPLSVSGRFIVDAAGRRVKLCGVNWAGAHQDQMVPGGLDYQPRQVIAEMLAGWGFNSVRFPFAALTVTSGSPVPAGLVSANPDLVGKTPWQVYRACVAALTAAELKVIPNYHLLFPGWCCADDDGNGLWWNDNHPSSEFTNNWLDVATELADNPLVIGGDLKNEPRNATIGGTVYTPTWGTGSNLTDFRAMYSNTASRIQAVAPGWLFMCEGLSYAGNLTAAAAHPVTPDKPGKVVYSAHDYSWYHNVAAGQPPQTPAQYAAQMDANSGYLLKDGTAPVWVGEFGCDNDKPATFTGPGWFASFAAWAKALDVDWCWWQVDGTMRKGTTPTTNVLQMSDGDRAGFGLFASDWSGPANRVQLEALQDLMPATLGPGI